MPPCGGICQCLGKVALPHPHPHFGKHSPEAVAAHNFPLLSNSLWLSHAKTVGEVTSASNKERLLNKEKLNGFVLLFTPLHKRTRVYLPQKGEANTESFLRLKGCSIVRIILEVFDVSIYLKCTLQSVFV